MNLMEKKRQRMKSHLMSYRLGQEQQQKRRKIGRRNNEKQNNRNRLIAFGITIATIIFLIWFLVIIGFFYNDYDDLPESSLRRGEGGDKLPLHLVDDKENHDTSSAERYNIDPKRIDKESEDDSEEEENKEVTNYYNGWQPKIETDCSSFRKCFNKDHICPKTCRDDPKDLEDDHNMNLDLNHEWVPDVTMLHRMASKGFDSNGDPWPPALPDELCEPIGLFGGKNDENKVALEAIGLHVVHEDEEDEDPVRVLCLMYTMEEAHATTIRAIRETWASHCDGYLAFSTKSDPRIPAISIPHEGEESYNNMWQKVRSIWKFVHEHYIDDFDYFFLGGDDLFVIPENLRSYLSTLEPDTTHFVGRRFKGYGKDNYFNSGGAGYGLSQRTLRDFRSVMDDHQKCSVHAHTAMEDVMIAQCLREALGINFTDTRDAHKRERFHPFAPATHYQWTHNEEDWYEKYNKEWGILLGEDCCAPDSVSFHYIKKPAMVRHMFALIYQCQ